MAHFAQPGLVPLSPTKVRYAIRPFVCTPMEGSPTATHESRFCETEGSMSMPYLGKSITPETGAIPAYEGEATMTRDQAKTAFLVMSPSRKMQVLALLA